MLNIFEEFNNQIKSLTDIRVGDVLYELSYYNQPYEVKVESLGFNPSTGKLVINGYNSTYYFRTKEEAVVAGRSKELARLKSSVTNKRARIVELTKEIEAEQKEMAELTHLI